MMRIFLITLMAVGYSKSTLAFKSPERVLFATQEWFPFQYQENGEIKGSNIEKMKCVMGVMDQPYQLTMTKWDRAQLEVEAGSQDGFFLASHNSKRDRYAEYSTPLDEQDWSWFFLSNSGVAEMEDTFFKSQIEVAAMFGSNKWLWLHKKGYRVSKKPRTAKALIKLMLNEEVGAILGNEKVINEAINDMGLSHREISIRRVKSKPLGVYFSRAFTKKYPHFLNKFNDAVAQCR